MVDLDAILHFWEWSPREEAVIEKLQTTEAHSRGEAIRTMRRRGLDDLKGYTLTPEQNRYVKTRLIGSPNLDFLAPQHIENKPLKMSRNSSNVSYPKEIPPEFRDRAILLQTEVDSEGTKKRGRKRQFGTAAERKAANRAAQKDNSEIILPPLPTGVGTPDRKRLSENKTDPTIRNVLLQRQSNTCFFCRRKFGMFVRKGEQGVPQRLRAEVDHFIPRGELGSRADDNLHACCQICNIIKRRYVGFKSIEQCRLWLTEAWKLNGYTSLGTPTVWHFSDGKYEWPTSETPQPAPAP